MLRDPVIAAFLGVALAASGGVAHAAEPPGLTGKYWRLAEFGGQTFPPKPEGNAQVIFRSDGKFSGYAFCNSMFSTYTVADDKLAIKPIGVTMRACIDPADNDREQAFLKALREARAWRVEGEGLTLLDGTGGALIRFVALPQ